MVSSSTDGDGRGPELAPASPWEPIDRLREAARLLLEAVELESGHGSDFHRQCQEVWQRAEGEASVSLLHGDFRNAFSRLDHALHILAKAPEIARRSELGSADLAALLRAV